ncbi:MAG: penicillin-binding protein 2 [Pseudomonadota bacterium]|nr:penicillin-binding protein 2 [Pseudomonadota bacterium]
MTELRNVEQELDQFRTRILAAGLLVLVCFGLIVARLLVLQVVKHEEMSTRAEKNRISIVPIVPNRGLIVDRNGVVLADNYSAYTLEITRSQLVDELDVVIEQLSEVVEIPLRDRRRFKRLMGESKRFESLPIRTKLTDEEVARFTAQRYRFPGVEIKARLFRNYPFGDVGGHLLGYIGRISQREKDEMAEWSDEDQANYRGTEVIGKLGIEQSYERELHGATGFEEVETSAGGHPVRLLRSEPATPGHTVRLSIDIKLQDLVEELFGKRRGALVAIDPRNGEVLAFVSKPGFDPNLFVGGIDQDSWRELNESLDKPLLNRALRGTYPPGSTYKPFMAMAALITGKRTAGQVIMDNGSFMFGDHRFRSHGDHGLGAVDMIKSIAQSSNVYYYMLASEMGVDMIHDQMAPYGFGGKTGIDLEGESTGDLPSTEWKRRKYKRPEQKRWYAGETISLGIGQGYNNFTMLQLASAQATLLAGGRRYAPRVVRAVEDAVTRETRVLSSHQILDMKLRSADVDVIKQAMHGVTQSGTATKVFAGAPYPSGGKTGTAQAVTIRQNEKYNASRLAEYKRDHSLYTAFAPLDEPRIALAVIVENAGFGAEAAAPIARRVLDYVIAGRYPSPEDIALVQKGQAGAPVGPFIAVSDVPLPPARSGGMESEPVQAVASTASAVTAPRQIDTHPSPLQGEPVQARALRRWWVPRRDVPASAPTAALPASAPKESAR